MEATTRDLELEQGTDWEEIVEFLDEDDVPMDLTGWDFDFCARLADNPEAPIAFTWSTSLIASGDPERHNKSVRVRLPRDVTSSLELPVSNCGCHDVTRFRYEWNVSNSIGDKRRWVKGIITMHPEIRHE